MDQWMGLKYTKLYKFIYSLVWLFISISILGNTNAESSWWWLLVLVGGWYAIYLTIVMLVYALFINTTKAAIEWIKRERVEHITRKKK